LNRERQAVVTCTFLILNVFVQAETVLTSIKLLLISSESARLRWRF